MPKPNGIETMNKTDFFTALRHIDRADPERHWPHHLIPGAWSDGVSVSEEAGALTPSQANYNGYQYNPPGLATALFPDADAAPTVRPQPTWEEIEAAYRAVKLEVQRRAALDSLDELRREASRRITIAYGKQRFQDEAALRLRGGHTEEQDAERDRLRAVYRALKLSLAGMNDAQLLAFDPADDNHWRKLADDA